LNSRFRKPIEIGKGKRIRIIEANLGNLERERRRECLDVNEEH